jgi:hypothetical protein
MNAWVLFLVPLFVTGVAAAPDLPEATEVPARAAYEVMRPLAAGCTPILLKYSAGSLSVGGCPTHSCPNSSCQWDGSDSAETMSCYCIDGTKPLCKGIVSLDEYGLPAGWACIRVACPNPCGTVAEPIAPLSGVAEFFVCDC